MALYNIVLLTYLLSAEVHRWRNKLDVWVTVYSPSDISGLRRPKNVNLTHRWRLIRG